MLDLYAQESRRRIELAEQLIAEGIEQREAAMSMLDRAKAISEELARFLDSEPGTQLAEEDIAW